MIKEINILAIKTHTADEETYYDVTDARNGKFIASYVEDEKGYYTVTIEGEGGIVANQDSEDCFADIGRAVTDEEVRFNGLSNIDTGMVANMSRMFAHSGFKSLDLSSFNTRNLTECSGAFEGCESLEVLNLKNFDMSKVEESQKIIEKAGTNELKILTNKSTYEWFEKNNPEYLFYIEIIESDYPELNK